MSVDLETRVAAALKVKLAAAELEALLQETEDAIAKAEVSALPSVKRLST
jgi:hypothetical protein